MAEEFVSRNEFEEFRKETREDIKSIHNELKGDKDLLHEIDKKVDSIIANLKISNDAEKTEKTLTEKIVDLKLEPVQKDVNDLKSAKTWATRLLIGELVAILGLIIKAAGIF